MKEFIKEFQLKKYFVYRRMYCEYSRYSEDSKAYVFVRREFEGTDDEFETLFVIYDDRYNIELLIEKNILSSTRKKVVKGVGKNSRIAQRKEKEKQNEG